MSSTRTTTIVADGHVHLHRRFDAGRWLDAARDNLARHAPPDDGPALHVLLLTESAEADAFAALAAGELRPGGGWTVDATGEPEVLDARDGEGTSLRLVAGRQIATDAGLELLALGTSHAPPDGRGLEASLEAVRGAGAVPVVPWGFGKWWGERGRRLSRLVEAAGPGSLCLGDNGGRPRYAPEPALFRRARARGVQIVPGSDPLPFMRHERRAGSAGFVARLELDPMRPLRGLLDALPRPDTVLRPFARRPGPLRFARDQLAMQARRLTGRRAG